MRTRAYATSSSFCTICRCSGSGLAVNNLLTLRKALCPGSLPSMTYKVIPGESCTHSLSTGFVKLSLQWVTAITRAAQLSNISLWSGSSSLVSSSLPSFRSALQPSLHMIPPIQASWLRRISLSCTGSIASRRPGTQRIYQLTYMRR